MRFPLQESAEHLGCRQISCRRCKRSRDKSGGILAAEVEAICTAEEEEVSTANDEGGEAGEATADETEN